MSIKLPFENMTTEEKIQAMESLWQDLCEHPDDIESLAWHGEILAEREKALTDGKDSLIDWEMAKEEINKKL